MGTDTLDFERRKQLAELFTQAIEAQGETTMEQLADKVGVNRYLLSSLRYNGWSAGVRAENLMKISEALHVDFMQIAAILGYHLYVGQLTPMVERFNQLAPNEQRTVLGEIDALLARHGAS